MKSRQLPVADEPDVGANAVPGCWSVNTQNARLIQYAYQILAQQSGHCRK
jgi:hypothetical protein